MHAKMRVHTHTHKHKNTNKYVPVEIDTGMMTKPHAGEGAKKLGHSFYKMVRHFQNSLAASFNDKCVVYTGLRKFTLGHLSQRNGDLHSRDNPVTAHQYNQRLRAHIPFYG